MKFYYVIGGITFLLVGCDSFKNSLGLDHQNMDEFSTQVYEPLKIPSFDGGDLKVPMSGGIKRSKESPLDPKVSGLKRDVDTTLEISLVQKLRKDRSVDPNIRSQLDQEADEEEAPALKRKIKQWKNELSKNLSSIGGS